ncbi:unnamed protein product, partial [Ostreobium quekettii]
MKSASRVAHAGDDQRGQGAAAPVTPALSSIRVLVAVHWALARTAQSGNVSDSVCDKVVNVVYPLTLGVCVCWLPAQLQAVHLLYVMASTTTVGMSDIRP